MSAQGDAQCCPRPGGPARDAAGRRVMVIPIYWVAWAMVTVLALSLGSFFGSIAIANQNSRELVARYRADQAATAAGNRVIYCAVFARQADVFADAESEVGKAAYEAWLQLYRLAGCEPAR